MPASHLPGFRTERDQLERRGFAVSVFVAFAWPAVIASAATQLIVSNDPCLLGPCPATAPPPPTSVISGSVFPLVVVAFDAEGSRDSAYRGTVHFSSSDPHATLPATFTFTAADAGGRQFSASFRTLGSQSITGTDDGVPPLSGTLTLDVTSPSQGIPALSARAAVAFGMLLILIGVFFLRQRP